MLMRRPVNFRHRRRREQLRTRLHRRERAATAERHRQDQLIRQIGTGAGAAAEESGHAAGGPFAQRLRAHAKLAEAADDFDGALEFGLKQQNEARCPLSIESWR